jgi:voltage-gated potassium channel
MRMSFLERWAQRDEQADRVGRHTILLSSLVLLLVMLPVFRVIPGGGMRFSILLCLVLSAAIYFNSSDRRLLIVAILAGGGAMVGAAFAQATGSTTAQITADSLGLTLLGFTTLSILNTLMQTRRVSRDTIVGGICVYLLIGLCFTLAYILVTDLGLGVLLDRSEPILRSSADGSGYAANILYFSFVTLTTLGYGDITPTGEMARMLASIEAIIGQLYIAIFIARLIALRKD